MKNLNFFRGAIFLISVLISLPSLIECGKNTVASPKTPEPPQQNQGRFVLKNVHPITDGKIFYMYPNWSPDGKKIACTSAGYRGIYIMDTDGSNLTEITSDPSSGFKFVWTPDSKNVVYVHKEYKRVNGRLQISYHLKIANIISGNIATIYSSKSRIMPPFVSSDGYIWTRINNRPFLFDSSGNRFTGEKKKKVVFLNDAFQILISTMDGTEERVITPENMKFLGPILSPDGTRILADFIGTGVVIIDIASRNIKELGKGFGAQWSPDGQYIIYHLAKFGHFTVDESDLFVIKAEEAEKTQLTFTSNETELHPQWSPDGKKVVYFSDSTGRIFVADIVKRH